MRAIAYYDGKIGAPDELTVPFNDRVHFFGDGVYDATVGANGKVYLLQDHLDRFYASAASLDIRIPMEKEELGRLLTDLLSKVDGKYNFVYWQVTRGVAERNHVFDEDMMGKLWVLVRPQKLNDPDEAVSLNDAEDTRFYHCNIKTLNLLPSVMYSQNAKRQGCYETVLHRGELVTECAHSNVSVLKDGVLYSHPNDELILRGIAKTHMIQACYRLGIQVIEKPFTMDFLRNADEVIVTSSSNFFRYANTMNGEPVGGKDPKTRNAIRDAVLEEFYGYTGCKTLWDE
ncbi:MAG: aminotransferase class IV [Oscillospiraceae bacterium]|nr:aminotransferase class IV [Oscillospiraceae bacterium]